MIQSPAEAAARTAPPTPAPILVPVEERVLTSNIVTRGTARYGLPQSVSIAPSTLKPAIGVITTLPLRNTQLNEGDVMLTASGRPVFVLQGERPVYRDFVPGVSGNDVRQLEESLRRLGFDPGLIDGTYDEQTSAAVADWYRSVGWPPFEPTDDQLRHKRTLEQELATALHNKATTSDAVAVAALAVEAARAAADLADQLAAAEVADKSTLRDEVMADPMAGAQDRAKVNADLEIAQAAALVTRLEGAVAVQTAVEAQKVAEREARLAADLADRIAADLDIALHKAGVPAPADEIIFLPTLPVRVEEIAVVVGDAASGPILVVTNNQLVIDSSLPLDEAPLVESGMKVAVDEPDLGVKTTGVVARVAGAPGTDGVDGFHIYFETLVDNASSEIEGFSLRLTIPVQSTGETVIAVPVSALSLSADGRSRVQVAHNGALEFVIVEPGLSADGFVEVTPVDGTLAPGQLVVIGYES
jgi:peptidoglycan hydrolase-like protein with peptidoglycan-binding domain